MEKKRAFLNVSGMQDEAYWDFFVHYKERDGAEGLFLLWNGAWVLEGAGVLQEITRQEAVDWMNGHEWDLVKGGVI